MTYYSSPSVLQSRQLEGTYSSHRLKGGGGIVERLEDVIREVRLSQKQNQHHFAERFNLSRESIIKYESGERKLPIELAHVMIGKFNATKLAITLKYQASGVGAVWLNGDLTDLHRSAVKEKTIEEVKEALEAIEKNSMVIPLDKVHAYQFTDIQKMLKEIAQAINALEMYLAVICEEVNINYKEVWDGMYSGLIAKGYLKAK